MVCRFVVKIPSSPISEMGTRRTVSKGSTKCRVCSEFIRLVVNVDKMRRKAESYRTNSPTVQRILLVLLRFDCSGCMTILSLALATFPLEDAMTAPSPDKPGRASMSRVACWVGLLKGTDNGEATARSSEASEVSEKSRLCG
jgi:hypothetical protein